MKKQKTKVVSLLSRTKVLPVLVLIAVIALSATSIQIVRADSIQQQIDNLNKTNSQAQQSVNSLQLQASSYQDAINKLSTQISSIQAAIAASTAKQTSIQAQINIDQAKLTQEKQVLGDDIKSMYVNGTMTTVEMLATSNNLSSFVDAETYRGAVQTKIQGTLTEISNLENSLESQKNLVDQLLSTQQAQQATLNSDESEQSNLLAMDQNQQSTYNQQIKNNSAQIQKLQAEQAAQLAQLEGSVTYGGSGNYPWTNAPCLDGPGSGSTCGNYDWGYPSGVTPLYGAPQGAYDPWGYEYRNCTSYVAWKIDSLSTSPIIGSLISGLGNAATWPSNAQGRGVSVSDGSGARYGDAAVDPGGGGWQGHVMFVEHVNGDGSILVSQYNAMENGTYSTAIIPANEVSGLDFVHFPGM